LDDNVPFAISRNLIVDIPINLGGYTDVYTDNMMGLTNNLPSTKNAKRLEVAILLPIEVAARPNDLNEPIPCEKMVAKDSLTVEGGILETKIILGWHFNFQTLTVTIPEYKHIMWLQEIQLMIQMRKTTKKTLESMIGHMGHIGFVIPWVYHFLSHLRSLLTCSWNRRMITIDNKCTNNLVLMQLILNKVQSGINMNLLAFRSPN
jgi:hypothetical protein